ncbi:MAG: glycosyltransferase family 2 protein, partial [Candidatus Omnitrophica bacterium]|nr:glycosyltransferase family 2 protein [Candidatus Omnitrophota bacterium]
MIRETLSVVIITKDEEANIRECLEGVKWADEIVIVDDMSLDRTVTICREYTDKIFSRKMDGFGAQKQYGIDKATGDWVLSLDADERLSPELESRIKRILETGSQRAGYRIWRKTFYLGVLIRHCGWYNS